MHSLEIPAARLLALGVSDWWTVTPADLERIANALLGPLPGGWVRQGANFVRVGQVKYGADARRLDAELTALSAETQRILSSDHPASALRAATFFHLRFENIHPLVEANGRLGRVILAGQLQQTLCVPATDTLRGLQDWAADYARLFATNDGPLMFELLLDLLSRITGIAVAPEDARLPASIEPLHPQKNVPKNTPRLHPEKAMADPDLVRQFARQHRPPPRPAFYGKFQ